MLTERLLQVLAEQDTFLSGSEQLARKVWLPDALFERPLFLSRGEEGKRYIAESRVLPGETAFRRTDCAELFGRIYPRSSVSSSDETEEYCVLGAESGEIVQHTVFHGNTERISCSNAYARLNRSGELPGDTEGELKIELSAYAAAREVKSEPFFFGADNMASLMAQRGAEVGAVSGN